VKATATLLPLATLGIGIAIGWFARPMPEPSSTVNEKSSGASSSRSSDTKPLADARPAKPAKPDRERPDPKEHKESTAKAKEMMGKMQDAALGRQRTKLEQYAATLKENLKLSPDQVEKLKAAVESQLAEIEKMLGGSGGAMSFGGDLAAVTADPLEACLAGTLSAEQQADLDSFKQREKTRKADAIALKSLSQLQGIVEFKEGQRDQVYEILTRSAEASVATPDPAADLSNMLTDGMGVEMDPYGLGLQKLLTESMADTALQKDQQAGMKKFREVFEKRVDEKVEELRPVLDDAQLERYRAELKAKGAGPFSAMMMGME
jgi:hypothetical protein